MAKKNKIQARGFAPVVGLLLLTGAAIALVVTIQTVVSGGLFAQKSQDVLSLASSPVPSPQPTTYLYVDNGTRIPDSISGYQITKDGLVPLPGSPYVASGAGQFTPDGGASNIATSLANGPCVFNTDSLGTVQSWSVDKTNGALTQVSQVTIGYMDNPPGGAYIRPDGKTLFVMKTGESGVPSWIYSIPVGGNCTFGTPTSVVSGASFYESLVVVNQNLLIAGDISGARLDLYQIKADGSLQLSGSQNAQFLTPTGLAVGANSSGTFVFTGYGDFKNSRVEGFKLIGGNSLVPMAGSPVGDNQGKSGPYVLADNNYQQLFQTQPDSNSIGIYSVPFGKVAHVALPNVYSPGKMIEFGNTLYILGYNLGQTSLGLVESCTIGSLSLSSCKLAATLPAQFPQPSGIGILTIGNIPTQ